MKLLSHKYSSLQAIFYFLVFCCTFVVLHISFQRAKYDDLTNYLRDIKKNIIWVTPKTHVNQTFHNWQILGIPIYRHMVYSAIFDPQNTLDHDLSQLSTKQEMIVATVRVFAVFHRSMIDGITCSFKGGGGFLKSVNSLPYSVLPEHHSALFAGFVVDCPLKVKNGNGKFEVNFPTQVAISYLSNSWTVSKPVYLDILYKKNAAQKRSEHSLAVCVGPLHHHYSNVLRIAEFIEVYKLLGVEKFYFYALNASANTLSILQFYRASGSVEILPWKIDEYKGEKEIHYYGVVVAFNECVYRSTFVDGFKYTAIVDLDEILIPFRHNTLEDLIEANDDKNIAEFNFRTVFFHKRHKNDSSLTPNHVLNKFLYTQVKVEHTKEPFPELERSKYIVKGELANIVGNHFVWKNRFGTKRKVLNVMDGLVFHYRDEDLINTKWSNLEVDFRARRFGSILWENVDKICKLLFNDGICPCV